MNRRLLFALCVVAATQRWSLASVPPVESLIGALTGIDAFQQGLATTLTIAMMAVGSPLSAQLAHRVSRERVLAIGAGAVAFGCAVRALPPPVVTLYLGSVAGGLGIAAIGTMVPGVIAERLPRRTGLAVGLTTFSLTLAAVLASSLTAPVAASLGVPFALGMWAIPSVLALIIWIPFTRGTTPAAGTRVHLPWHSTSAWLSVALMTGQTVAFVTALAWVSPSFEADGLGLDTAGFLLGAVTIGNMVGALVSPLVTSRSTDRRPVLMLTLALTVGGAAYLAWGSTTGSVVAMLLLGLGLGGGFGVALALLIDLGASPAATAALSAMTFLVAYLVGAPCPALAGWVRDSTGGFSVVWWTVAAVAVVQVPVALRLGPRRYGSVAIPSPEAHVVPR